MLLMAIIMGLLVSVYLVVWIRNARYLSKPPAAKLTQALSRNKKRSRVVRLCRTDRARLRA